MTKPIKAKDIMLNNTKIRRKRVTNKFISELGKQKNIINLSFVGSFIDKNDFMEFPEKKYFRLAPGKEVRLRHAFNITCEKIIKDNRIALLTKLSDSILEFSNFGLIED